MTSNVISFSLYGSDSFYCDGALQNIELAKTYYPGWAVRIYLDASVSDRYVAQLKAKGADVRLVDLPSLGPMYGRYWRYLIAAEDQVDHFIVRDVDSRLNARESCAVAEWIGSGRSFHIMRDSFHHSKRVLGGMWGGKGGNIPNIAELINGWGSYDRWGQCDQFNSEVIFPIMGQDYICHDSLNHFGDSVSFPPHPPLLGTRFVGERVAVDEPQADIWREAGELQDVVASERRKNMDLIRELAVANLRLRISNISPSAKRCRPNNVEDENAIFVPACKFEPYLSHAVRAKVEGLDLILMPLSTDENEQVQLAVFGGYVDLGAGEWEATFIDAQNNPLLYAGAYYDIMIGYGDAMIRGLTAWPNDGRICFELEGATKLIEIRVYRSRSEAEILGANFRLMRPGQDRPGQAT
ncbi:hypothetical protein [Methylobacterium sp.]|uniref:hypothetical protein n=1 Tax=Methylobacterium sp. TaxID=409 RepID=UPI000FA809F3|nr:hypothetical protein [Methylobacterium sp.]RUP23198.1 MAG: hypothetical protein EKK44_00925 [Methylobacterium sp.]